MNFNHIKGYVGVASKLLSDGNIKYSLWVDTSGKLYMKLEKNDGGGSFSKYLFPVSDYARFRGIDEAIKKPMGYDTTSGDFKESKYSADPGFIKDVLKHLLPSD